MHTSAIPREPRARTHLEIADKPAPPSLADPPRPHSSPNSRRNTQTGRRTRDPNGADARRAQLSAPALVLSAHCSAERASTTPPRALHCRLPPIDTGCSSLLSITRNLRTCIAAQAPFSAVNAFNVVRVTESLTTQDLALAIHKI